MIIREFVASNGVHIRIDDDKCAPRGSEEERRVIRDACRAAYDILKSCDKSTAEEKLRAWRSGHGAQG